MCDQTSPEGRDVTSAAEPQQITVDHLRRAAQSCRDLGDPALMAKAWDELATPDLQSAADTPRVFGQLRSLSVPNNFDDPLSNTEITAWEGNSPSRVSDRPSGEP